MNNNPGVIVPPPPEKQAVGRFDNNFVESRRSALERMLNRTAMHPILMHDGDLKLFLESEAFSVDIRHKEKQNAAVSESKGVFGSLGFGGGMTGKFIESDEVPGPVRFLNYIPPSSGHANCNLVFPRPETLPRGS